MKIKYRVCILCGKKLPADLDHFHQDRSNSDGTNLNIACRPCMIELANKRYQYVCALERASKAHIAFCSNCDRAFPATTEFYGPDSNHSNGLSSWCRCCCNLAAKARYDKKKRKEGAKDGD